MVFNINLLPFKEKAMLVTNVPEMHDLDKQCILMQINGRLQNKQVIKASR